MVGGPIRGGGAGRTAADDQKIVPMRRQ
jgi:hypothetical protein